MLGDTGVEGRAEVRIGLADGRARVSLLGGGDLVQIDPGDVGQDLQRDGADAFGLRQGGDLVDVHVSVEHAGPVFLVDSRDHQ